MLEKMKELIADRLSIDEDKITLDARFNEDLDADSLDLFDLVMALEEEYDIEIPTEELETLTTVGSIIDYLKEHGVEE
ncbi:MAG: acyl carrier protein [Lachnospiraceae bacterium]|nr:acyl carrier protein [Lachnospiraceae bacterium]